MAELWHFLGRIGVPIVYTWPAGHPGLFGYTYDRESSEFTIYHLRQLLEFIASFPEVEKINIIAHSRGTDVAVTALRELTIEGQGSGTQSAEKYTRFIILCWQRLTWIYRSPNAAPDRRSYMAWSADRFTIYTSPADKAIGWANKLFASPKGRVGNLRIEDMTDEARAVHGAWQLDAFRRQFHVLHGQVEFKCGQIWP